jgi:flotillin
MDVKGVATVKILSDQASLMAACERFLGMKPEEIREIAFNNLEGHLRAIIGRLTVEEFVSDRTKLNHEILAEAKEDLQRIGMGVDVLTIQEIKDQYGYIQALGKGRTAQVIRDADIGEAEAKRDAAINASNATRQAEQTKLNNEAQIAEARKTLEVKKAQYDAEIKTEQALANQAGNVAAAEAQEQVVAAQKKVATEEANRKEQELLSTEVKPAEAAKLVTIARAEAESAAMIKAAEADKQAAQARGEGEAAAIRARGQAEADAIRAKLLAEAEGILKKAEAYEKLGQSGQTLQIMEQLQLLIPAALEKLGPVMAEIARPLGSVDRISLVDIGNGNGQEAGSIGKFAQTVPLVLVQLIETMKGIGLDPSNLMSLLQIQEERSPKDVRLPATVANSNSNTND